MVVEKNIIAPRGFEWGSVFAGTMAAVAITLVMVQFGAGIGLSMDSPLRGEATLASWSVIIAGLWLLWTQVMASLVGGYIAGRLRTQTVVYAPHDNEIRDGLHGLATWATSTVLVFIGVSLVSGFATYVALTAGVYEDPTASMTNAEQNTAIVAGFVTGAVSLVCGVASWWAAVVGGDHRDNPVDYGRCWSFLKR